ncbi:ATP-binding protein [Roseofilum casamattae]|uniref:histidine kinase n=1 Tax=Roseofilum casamattae BLCC-M143 TaxID=3022442 RepID=A0ABT7BTJ3_9CYAN|nr:ATP-binding protein [Roseofilum casamattae]MDJ1182504.1 ATP-binding protein [Roseofilum casamattae BLCC-M143]
MLPNYGKEIPPYEEEINHIGLIQHYGVLLAIDPESLNVIYTSENLSDLFTIPANQLLGHSLTAIIPEKYLKKIIAQVPDEVGQILSKRVKVSDNGKTKYYPVLVHRNLDGYIIWEFETSPVAQGIEIAGILDRVQQSSQKIKANSSILSACEVMADEIKSLTHFDRVMIYQYDDQYNGKVVAEAREKNLSPLLGLHFPRQDTQACLDILELIWSRTIPHVSAQQFQIVSDRDLECDRSLDLTYTILRGCSSCHQEYLGNMGVSASLVLSLKKEGKLWGLVSCHHYSPKRISYQIQKTCEFLCQIFSADLSTKTEYEIYEHRVESNSVQSKLLAFMGRDRTFVDGLVNHKPNLLDLVNAEGAAILWNGTYTPTGIIPEEKEIRNLIKWLDKNQEKDIFSTQSLADIYPPAKSFNKSAVGLLALHISQHNYILWFRPEVLQTVSWAGNPNESYIETQNNDNDIQMSPRTSFDAWKEIVEGKSLPWKSYEIEAVRDLKQSLIHIILDRVDELSRLTQELERSNEELEKFAYIASHDLQEPLNLIASYVELLEMRYESLFDRDGKEFMGFVLEGVSHMQALIDDLLVYSRVGRNEQLFERVDLQASFDRTVSNLQLRISEIGATISHDPLPTISGDSVQLTQLLQNLISNGLKFHSDRPPQIHVGVRLEGQEWLLSVEDNGIGIEPEMSDRIFTIFQRLHTREEYPGTGIGLAICKKIVEFHGGRIWVVSQVGRGSTFYFTLPRLEA